MTDPLRPCYTDASVWDNFEPGLLTLCSPDPQAIRPPGEKINVLQVTLPTNFKAARFDSDTAHRDIAPDAGGDRSGPLRSRRRPDRSAGQAQGARLDLRAARQMGDAADRQLPLRDPGPRHRHQGRRAQRPRDIALGLRLGMRACARGWARRPDDLVPFEKYAARRTIWCGRPRPRARCSTARPTSSGPTGWCRRSRRNTACATPSSIRPSRWSTRGSPPTGKPPPNISLLRSRPCDAGAAQAPFRHNFPREQGKIVSPTRKSPIATWINRLYTNSLGDFWQAC